MKTPQEILAEWADPETGGTMPREVREAALSVLAQVDELKERWEAAIAAHDITEDCLASEARVKELEADVIYEQERNRLNVQQNEARVRELEAKLAEAVPQYGEVQSLRDKLQRVRDWLKYAANSEGGIVAEIDVVLKP